MTQDSKDPFKHEVCLVGVFLGDSESDMVSAWYGCMLLVLERTYHSDHEPYAPRGNPTIVDLSGMH